MATMMISKMKTMTDFSEDDKMATKKRNRKNNTHDCMVRLYGRLVMWGTYTMDDVPENLQPEVKAWVDENMGY